MLGEQFTEPNFVVGMILKLKPQFDKISIWLRDSTKGDAITKTRQEICTFLEVQDSDLEFMVFKEIKNRPAPTKKWNKDKPNFKKDGAPIKR